LVARGRSRGVSEESSPLLRSSGKSDGGRVGGTFGHSLFGVTYKHLIIMIMIMIMIRIRIRIRITIMILIIITIRRIRNNKK
jgi:hypothetical protein